MTNIEPFLYSMLSVPGLSGFEGPVREIIAEQWHPLVDEISISRIGSLHAIRKASAPERPSLLIAAHMDAVGLMVRKIENGFLQISPIGGLDTRILPGQPVIVHGKKEIPGIVQMLPDRLMPSIETGKPPRFSRLFVDTGYSDQEIKELVRVGTLVSFAQPPLQMGDGYLAGHSLDNRASVAALTVCLEELKNFNLQWNTWFAATVQEEERLHGAYTSAYQIQPDLAIAVDVTFAKGPGSDDYHTFPLGKGPTLGIGPNIHPAILNQFRQLVEEMDMPYSIETMPLSSGTDGMAMQVTAAGIPNMVLSIPIRYMHTPIEMVSINDIMRAGRLLARFITKLKADSLTKLFAGQPL